MCKSNYYSLGDLCLTECSLIQGYHNVYQKKECSFEELTFVNDCIYKTWYIDQAKEANFCTISDFCPENLPYAYNSTGECIESCRYSELISGDCYISNILGGTANSLIILKNQIISLGDDIFEKNDENKIHKSIVLYGNNITIEITDTEKMKNEINFNTYISEINFTECENSLRQIKNTPDDKELIVLKIDLRRNDTIGSKIEYEIYDSVTKTLLDLSSCKNMIIHSPINVNPAYSEKIREIYNERYDIFNINEKFYSDLCIPYMDKKFNADLTIGKRQSVYYYINSNLCEKNCEYIGFDIDKFKSICSCPTKKEMNLNIAEDDGIFEVEKNEQKVYYKQGNEQFAVWLSLVDYHQYSLAIVTPSSPSPCSPARYDSTLGSRLRQSVTILRSTPVPFP